MRTGAARRRGRYEDVASPDWLVPLRADLLISTVEPRSDDLDLKYQNDDVFRRKTCRNPNTYGGAIAGDRRNEF